MRPIDLCLEFLFNFLDIYYLRYPKDSWRIKSLVYGLYIAEVIQTSLLTHDAVIVLGRGWGDITVVTDMHTLWFSGAIMNGTGWSP